MKDIVAETLASMELITYFYMIAVATTTFVIALFAYDAKRCLKPCRLSGSLHAAKDLPAGPFSGMVALLAPYKFRRILWHQAPESFAVSADGENYVWARAQIDGDSVLLSCPTAIKFIRYAWDDNPACPLYNGAGLPASPFQTKLNQEASGNEN